MNISEAAQLNATPVIDSSEERILQKYDRLKITDSTPIPTPVTVIKIKGETISTEGNITTISGPSKGGKSAFSGVLIAGAIAQGEYDGFPDVEVAQNMGKAVLHFDTEQARHKHQKNLKSILRRVQLDSCPENLLSYNIRQEEPEQYRSITDEIAGAAFRKFKGIHLIVIDGGADYIKDVNDPTQSNAIVKYFEDLAIKYQTAVVIIVHVNPGGEKERGHLGSQLQRKSESVLTVKTQGEKCCLEPKLLRMAGLSDIPLIEFIYDKQRGYHTWTGNRAPETVTNRDDQRLEMLKTAVAKAFAPPIALCYEDAIDRIMQVTNKQISTAKQYFKEMKAHRMITQGDDKNWRYNMDNHKV